MSEAGVTLLRRGLFVVVALAAGLLFFLSLGDLWPLARTDLTVSHERRVETARTFLEEWGHDLEGFQSAARLLIHPDGLDYAERAFSREQAQEWIAGGLPLVYHRVRFKRRGETTRYAVTLHPEAGVLGWSKWIDEDRPGERIPVEDAQRMALDALRRGLGLDPAEFREHSTATTEQTGRRTHVFGFERTVSDDPEFRERVRIVVGGDEVVSASRRLIVPDSARRAARAAAAPGVALEMLGFGLLGFFAVVAFWVFLARLREGTVRLGRAAFWPSLVFVCLMATFSLESASLFDAWEPLWPRWISDTQYLMGRAVSNSWILLVLLAVVAAGDSLDRSLGAGRGDSLWSAARGRILDPAVGRASARGFLVGLLCGGAMALALLGLQWIVDARTAIQPRGFFFYTLNTASPAATSLLFFTAVALAEELGYRFYAASWILLRTGNRWVAVVLPAIVYGLTHTNMSFLPPAEPFWARALVLTLVGCVWGWAFLRFDALTVVLSHFTADLFIFNWPRLASHDPQTVALSAAVVAAPLLPALLCGTYHLLRRSRA